MASNDLQGYKIQGIYYLNKRTHRIQQNVGGACPLLALCNTLFLNHQIHYNKGGRRIKFQELTDCLTAHLQNMLNSDIKDGDMVKTELQVDKSPKHKHRTQNTNMLTSALSLDDDDVDDEDEVDVVTQSIFEDDSHEEDIEDIEDIIPHDDGDHNGPPPLISEDDLNRDIKPPPKQTQTETEIEQKQISSTTATVDIEQKDKESNPISPNTEDNENKEEQQEEVEDDKTAEERAMDLKLKRIDECVQLFPKLEEGLDINIKFSDACDFEENPGYRMFSHYGFKLFHGWVVDPKQEKLHQLIGEKSYDETIDFLISDPKKDATEEEKKQLEEDKDVIRKFFAESATQLTSYGLERLYLLMDKEDELAIFFRNNHFSTIVKHQGIMYEFVTDEGIVDADPQITWQTLLQISGDEQFVNNKFQAIHTNISQYTQISQYNRLKFQADNGLSTGFGDDGNGGTNTGTGTNGASIRGNGGGGAGDDDEKKYPSHSLIGILNNALDYIDSQSFVKLKQEEEDIDPLVSHGLTQRTTDTVDKFMCKDFIFGMPMTNEKCPELEFNVRSFEMKDAKNILDLMTTAHDKGYHHYRNIDFMHHDNKYALILQIIDFGDDVDDGTQQQMKMEKKEKEEDNNPIIGCIQYEWKKFNFWDWRESDWEDYDTEMVYNMSNTGSYERRRLLRESGVRVEYFIRILDVCITAKYQNRGLGSQLLQSLIYAFPSGTRFGIDVPAENTAATKSMTKCGFHIARMEQQIGIKYKMCAESYYTFTHYQSWLMNSNVIIPKPTTIAHIETHKKPTTHPTQQQQHNTQSIAIEEHPVTPQRRRQGTGQQVANRDDVCIAVQGVAEYEDDEDAEDFHGISQNLHIPDATMMTPQRDSHHHHNPVMEQRKKRRHPEMMESGGSHPYHHDHESMHHPHHHGDIDDMVGTADDYESDIDQDQEVQHSSSIHHGGGQQGGHHGVGGGVMDNVGLFGYVSDNFIFSTLFELQLTKYHSTFTEFQITKDALLHLDPSVVEFMIPEENDRNIFLNWLTKHKQKLNGTGTDETGTGGVGDDGGGTGSAMDIDSSKVPSKAPQQHSTDVETAMTAMDEETDEEE